MRVADRCAIRGSRPTGHAVERPDRPSHERPAQPAIDDRSKSSPRTDRARLDAARQPHDLASACARRAAGARYRSAVVSSWLLLRTRLASNRSSRRGRADARRSRRRPTRYPSCRWCPTNDAPTWTSQSGGGGGRRGLGGGEGAAARHTGRASKRVESISWPAAGCNRMPARPAINGRVPRSHRSASAASIDAARAAGTRHATAATGSSSAGAATKATTSNGETPNRHSCIRRVSTRGAGQPARRGRSR